MIDYIKLKSIIVQNQVEARKLREFLEKDIESDEDHLKYLEKTLNSMKDIVGKMRNTKNRMVSSTMERSRSRKKETLSSKMSLGVDETFIEDNKRGEKSSDLKMRPFSGQDFYAETERPHSNSKPNRIKFSPVSSDLMSNRKNSQYVIVGEEGRGDLFGAKGHFYQTIYDSKPDTMRHDKHVNRLGNERLLLKKSSTAFHSVYTSPNNRQVENGGRGAVLNSVSFNERSNLGGEANRFGREVNQTYRSNMNQDRNININISNNNNSKMMMIIHSTPDIPEKTLGNKRPVLPSHKSQSSYCTETRNEETSSNRTPNMKTKITKLGNFLKKTVKLNSTNNELL